MGQGASMRNEAQGLRAKLGETDIAVTDSLAQEFSSLHTALGKRLAVLARFPPFPQFLLLLDIYFQKLIFLSECYGRQYPLG